MENSLYKLFKDNPSLIASCPVCNHRPDALKAKILEDSFNSHLIYLNCSNCRAGLLALVFTGSTGITSFGLVTDLSADDVLKFRKTGPISSDDVIDFHQALKKNKVMIDLLI